MATPRLQHTSLVVSPGSQEAVREFYGHLLGLKEKQPPPAIAAMQITWFEAGEGEMELHFIPQDELPTDKGQHFCLVVDDLEEYRRRLTAAGVAITEAEPIPNRPRFFCRDPFGNRIELTMIQGDYHTLQ